MSASLTKDLLTKELLSDGLDNRLKTKSSGDVGNELNRALLDLKDDTEQVRDDRDLVLLRGEAVEDAVDEGGDGLDDGDDQIKNDLELVANRLDDGGRGGLEKVLEAGLDLGEEGINLLDELKDGLEVLLHDVADGGQDEAGDGVDALAEQGLQVVLEAEQELDEQVAVDLLAAVDDGQDALNVLLDEALEGDEDTGDLGDDDLDGGGVLGESGNGSRVRREGLDGPRSGGSVKRDGVRDAVLAVTGTATDRGSRGGETSDGGGHGDGGHARRLGWLMGGVGDVSIGELGRAGLLKRNRLDGVLGRRDGLGEDLCQVLGRELDRPALAIVNRHRGGHGRANGHSGKSCVEELHCDVLKSDRKRL